MRTEGIKVRATAVLIEGGEVLLVEQRVSNARCWSLPGGGLEPGETLEACLLREVKEETGCKAAIDEYAGITCYEHGSRPKVVLFFHMSLAGGCKEIAMGPEAEVDACQWVTVPEAISILSYAAERNLLPKKPEAR